MTFGVGLETRSFCRDFTSPFNPNSLLQSDSQCRMAMPPKLYDSYPSLGVHRSYKSPLAILQGITKLQHDGMGKFILSNLGKMRVSIKLLLMTLTSPACRLVKTQDEITQNGQTSVKRILDPFHVLDTPWCHAHLTFTDNNFIPIFIEQNEIPVFSVESICDCFNQSNVSFSCYLTTTHEFHNINEINCINETYKYTTNYINNINYLIDNQERGSGTITLTQYLTTLESYLNILKHSMNWRLDHILDNDVPIDTKNQWIGEIKEIIETMIDNNNESVLINDNRGDGFDI